jgi:serine/threonine-protein kinase
VDQIGRYRILGELGRGATGVVYRAQDPAIGRTIAIKTIRLSDLTDDSERERLRERLFREAQSAGMLSHPNIVTIYDIAEENGLAYIFMECVDGPPLEKVLNTLDPPLVSDLALSILRQTAIGLDYAHQKGIVHRDIKPANILIHERSHAKITDFGVAKIVSQQMTQSGVMMGTPNYMSPEQVQGHAVDGRADQFSLAVIAYEMLTGEKPFLAEQLPALLFRIVREDPVAPQRLNPTLGPQVEMVLRKALAKAANDRYPTCAEFVDALSHALQLSPGWHPLPRSSSQNMPTFAGPAPGPARQPPAVKPGPTPEAPHPAQPSFPVVEGPPIWRTEEPEPRNPLLKSLVWMLVGIGLVGLVLFGAQKYVFNRSAEPAPATASDAAPSNTPAPTTLPADQASTKPSPVGQSPVDGQKAATQPATAAEQPPSGAAPDHTAAQVAQDVSKQDVSKQDASKPDVPKQETPKETAKQETPKQDQPKSDVAAPVRHDRAILQPAVQPGAAPKPDFQQSVQFLTEPPGAEVVVDANSAQTCKTPCMMPLSPGRHAMSVQLAGYRPYPRVFNVPQDSDIFLQLSKASGTLSVTSQPAGATIELDGTLQAKRTPALFNLPPGSYRIKVSRNGASLDFDVQLRDGEFITKKVEF